jgi:polyisoprenoid-binding protein YceI
MAPVRFTFDPERSCVWVNARSSLHPINTETRGLRGWVEVTPHPDGLLNLDEPVTGTLEVSADRLSSGNQLYDLELRRRIDARSYPTISGQITRVRSTDVPGEYLVTGDLSFHGRTRTFEHEMKIEIADEVAITLKGERVFDIREFNMKPPSMLMLKVYPEIAVKVELYGTIEP